MDVALAPVSCLRLGDGVEHRHVGELGIGMLGAALARRHAADDLRAVGQRLLGVERALAAGDALADDLGVLVDEMPCDHSVPAEDVACASNVALFCSASRATIAGGCQFYTCQRFPRTA